jgi:hypothetical protein
MIQPEKLLAPRSSKTMWLAENSLFDIAKKAIGFKSTEVLFRLSVDHRNLPKPPCLARPENDFFISTSERDGPVLRPVFRWFKSHKFANS